MLKIFEKINYYHLIFIVVIIAMGVFLRAWNFSDWLHFELDQARDAKIIDLAIEEGIGNLPLLGPKAAGSFLRLGPLFYYQEYVSALIFGNTPEGIAFLSLILSCFTLPLFYFFVRRYFNQKISLILLLLFSLSLFLIMYSRFAWNPNNLPFFVILTFYSLLRVCDQEERRKEMWLLIFSIALSFATQLHFVAFLSIPTISAIFLILKRPRIKITYWLVALGIIILFYSPILINEAKTGGENYKEFIKIFEKKSTQNEEKSFLEKVVKNYSENSLGYFLILSGYGEIELPKFSKLNDKFDLQCSADCKKNLPMGIVSLLIFTIGTMFLFFNFQKAIFKKENASKRDFIILILLCFLITFVLFFFIAYNMAPRFFLLVSFLPFVFLGFILESLEKRFFSIFLFFLVAAFSLSNVWFIQKRFIEMENAAEKPFKSSPDKILKERYRVTLEQQYKIIEYIKNFYKQNGFPVYLNSEAFWRRSFLYLLDKQKIPNDDFRNAKKIYKNGNYFLIYPTLGNLEIRKDKYLDNYDIVEKKQFGTLTVFRLYPKEEKINALQQQFGPKKKPVSSSGVPVRCRWNEIFKKCNPDEIIIEEETNN